MNQSYYNGSVAENNKHFASQNRYQPGIQADQPNATQQASTPPIAAASTPNNPSRRENHVMIQEQQIGTG